MLSTASEISKRNPGLRRHIPPILFLLSLAILGVALGRPQTEVSLPHIEGTVILAFDVSASMGAKDLTPTRMDAAKAAGFQTLWLVRDSKPDQQAEHQQASSFDHIDWLPI